MHKIPETPERLLAMAANVMTWDHPRFAEFADLVEAEVDRVGCDTNPQRPVTRRALAAVGCAVPPSLRWLELYGGKCDCTVLFNVIFRWQEGPEAVAKKRRAVRDWDQLPTT